MVSGICVSARCLPNVIHYITTGHLSRILQDNKDVKIYVWPLVCYSTTILLFPVPVRRRQAIMPSRALAATFPGSRANSADVSALDWQGRERII
jgi:hypothetical protein